MKPPTAKISNPVLNMPTSEDEPIPGIYKHYRGGLYEVFFTAKHSETLEDLVVYRDLANSPDFPTGLWVRPKSMFLELVEWNGSVVPRFSKQEITKPL